MQVRFVMYQTPFILPRLSTPWLINSAKRASVLTFVLICVVERSGVAIGCFIGACHWL